jgi:hypothetical protein
MKGISRLFWVEERQAREDEEREQRRKRNASVLHPGLLWVGSLSFAVAMALVAAPSRHETAVASLVLIVVRVTIVIGNHLLVRRKRAEGWEPIEGVDLPPRAKPGEAPIAVWFRWTFRPRKPQP